MHTLKPTDCHTATSSLRSKTCYICITTMFLCKLGGGFGSSPQKCAAFPSVRVDRGQFPSATFRKFVTEKFDPTTYSLAHDCGHVGSPLHTLDTFESREATMSGVVMESSNEWVTIEPLKSDGRTSRSPSNNGARGGIYVLRKATHRLLVRWSNVGGC